MNNNNNIKLIFNGICENCEEAELRLNMVNVWDEEKREYIKKWEIFCKYENVCQNTIERLMDKYEIERLVKRYEW